MLCKISKMFENEKSPETEFPPKGEDSNSKMRFLEVKAFYNKHFPTDRRTYNLRVPLFGLVVSVLTLHYVTKNFFMKHFFREDENQLLKHCYIFVAACLAYELYYGLKIGDRKQFTPWILLKFIELGLTLATVIYVGVTENLDYYYWHNHIADLVFGLVLLVPNGIVTYIVTKTSVKQFRGYVPKTDTENDTYDNV